MIQAFRALLLLTVLLAQTGCASSDADLNYNRDKPADRSTDQSYHGWN